MHCSDLVHTAVYAPSRTPAGASLDDVIFSDASSVSHSPRNATKLRVHPPHAAVYVPLPPFGILSAQFSQRFLRISQVGKNDGHEVREVTADSGQLAFVIQLGVLIPQGTKATSTSMPRLEKAAGVNPL